MEIRWTATPGLTKLENKKAAKSQIQDTDTVQICSKRDWQQYTMTSAFTSLFTAARFTMKREMESVGTQHIQFAICLHHSCALPKDSPWRERWRV